jgi:predicted ATPase
MRRGANVEAIKHLRHALAAIATQPSSAALKQSELSIQSRLGGANMSVHGWGAPDTQACFERAREIAREIGDLRALVSPLIGLWIVHLICRRIGRSMEASQELFGVARELRDDGLLLQAHHSAWPLSRMQGNFAQAQEHIDQGLAIYDEKRHADHRILYLNHDPAVCALCFGSSMEWMRGFPDTALKHELDALAMARGLAHQPTLASALWGTSEAQILRRDFDAVLESADELLRLCAEARIVEHVPYARIIRAWALAQQGHVEDGRREMESGLALLGPNPRHARISNLLALGAETSLKAGRYDEGLQRISAALEIVEGIGERYTEVNIRLIHGELLLHSARGGIAKAQAEVSRAVDVARAQGALSFELRATAALARLMSNSGERRQAYALLAPVYARFSEGFSTPALQETKSLLDALV